MKKDLKVGALLVGGLIGAGIGHYFNPDRALDVVLGALVGAFVVNWIIDMAD